MLVIKRMQYNQSAHLEVHALHYQDVEEIFFSPCTIHLEKFTFFDFFVKLMN